MVCVVILIVVLLQGITHVNEISFSLTDEGTTSLCELEFDTDLSYIFSASVGLSSLVGVCF